MSLTIPPELEWSLDDLRTVLMRAMSDLERLKTRHVLARAAVSHHQHDFTRDITSQPTTYPPDTHSHDALYSSLAHNHDSTYAAPAHTHTGYASDTHIHNYQDGQYILKPGSNVDVSRQTGGPV